MNPLTLLSIIFLLVACKSPAKVKTITNIDYVQYAQDFVSTLAKKENADKYIIAFREANTDELEKQLDTSDKKKAFWLNIYNGYILAILQKSPELYEDRKAFFSKSQIEIAGKKLSFADIEHGIIRRSEFQYFLGYVSNPFPGSFERKFRFDKQDYRIHFALNCGAKSCPPVRVYKHEKVEEQLEASTMAYLKKTTKFDATNKKAETTTLFSWFRGDFGGKSGAKKILFKRGIVPVEKFDVSYAFYDWTLDLENFIGMED